MQVIHVLVFTPFSCAVVWKTSPGDIAWMKVINEIAGGKPKAKAVLDEFLG